MMTLIDGKKIELFLIILHYRKDDILIVILTDDHYILKYSFIQQVFQ